MKHRRKPERPRPNYVWRIWLEPAGTEPIDHRGNAFVGTIGELFLRNPEGNITWIYAPGRWAAAERLDA